MSKRQRRARRPAEFTPIEQKAAAAIRELAARSVSDEDIIDIMVERDAPWVDEAFIDSALERRVDATIIDAWRPEVIAFANLMEAQLRKHDDRPGWAGMSNVDLISEMRHHDKKLSDMLGLARMAARDTGGDSFSAPSPLDIARAAADVGNFAMMLADNAGGLDDLDATAPDGAPCEPLPIETAPKDGRLLWLLVDYTNGDHPLADADTAWTIGFNQADHTGEDEWEFAGWCWQQDHFTQGRGRVIGWSKRRLPVQPDSQEALS